MTRIILFLTLIVACVPVEPPEPRPDGLDSSSGSTAITTAVSSTDAGLMPCVELGDCQPAEYCEGGFCLPCSLDVDLHCMCGPLWVDPESCGCELQMVADSETDGLWQCFCRSMPAPLEACVPI